MKSIKKILYIAFKTDIVVEYQYGKINKNNPQSKNNRLWAIENTTFQSG